MAGNAAFEATSTSSVELGFARSYSNGPRGVRGAGTGAGGGSYKFGVSRSGSGSSVLEDVRGMLSLENVVIGERVIWCDEVKKVLGVSGGSMSELEAPDVDMKDLKRFKLSVEDNCAKVRVRATKMDECLRKLDKYSEVVNTKKQKRSALVSNDRPGAGGYLKMGAQKNSLNQRVEDRPKNILLNKRVRTSVAESRAECQSNGLPRQHVTMAKDVNLLDDNGGESDLFEKMRRMAAGGEGWDNKIKRKRSVGAVSTRPVDSDGVPKRALQEKVVDDCGSLPRDAHVFRLNNSDDSPSNRKLRLPPSGSSSPPMAQWAGQRPQKMARARRANLASPLSIQDEKLLSFEKCSATDMGARLISNGIDGSPIYKKAADGPQKLIVKADNVQSSPRLSESEELVGGESRLMAKEIRNSEMGAIAKNKPLISAATPPVQRSKIGSKKNGSKPGRRLKKLSESKDFYHHPPFQNNSSPDCPGVSDDDRGELLAAANHARIASHLACTSAIWKRMEPVFASVSSDDKLFLSQQVGLLNEDFVSGSFSSGEREPLVQRQENGRHDSDKTSNGSIPFYQRVLSSLIVEDDTDTNEEGDARNMYASLNSTYETPRVSECKSFPSNGGLNSFRSSITNNICEDAHSEDGNSKSFLNGPQMLEAGLADCLLGSQYEEKCFDDKILLELQSIGLCPDTLVGPILRPTLDDEMDNETVQHEVDELKTRLREQEVKKKVCLEKILKNVESNSGIRDLETLAMDRLVELAYRKLLATRRSSRSGVQKVPKHVALAFGRRTLARCRKYEKSGTSCFSEPPYHDILSAPVENEPDPDILSDEAFTTNGPISNRGKKKELFLDDIGTAAIRPSSYLVSTSVSSGTKGKRSERDTTKSRKPKAKPKQKQKAGQQPTSGNRIAVNRPTGTTHPTGPTWPSSNVPRQLADNRTEGNGSANLLGDDLDPLDELGVAGPQDLTSFLNFDDQDIDEDFAGGLDIPMDDLTELF